MKKIMFTLLSLAIITATSCNKKEIENLEKENKQLNQRLTNLENKPEPTFVQTPTTVGRIFSAQVNSNGIGVGNNEFVGEFRAGDMIVLFYIRKIGDDYYAYNMPYHMNSNFHLNYDFDVLNGRIWVNAYNNNTGNYEALTSAVSVPLYGFLIKKEAIEQNPNIDLSNINEVMKIASNEI